VAGIISSVHKIFTKKNELMMFVTLDDSTGSLELIVFPRTLQKNPDLWQEDKFIFTTGKLSEKDDVPKILVDKTLEIDPNNPKSIFEDENNASSKIFKGAISLKSLNIEITINSKNFNTEIHNSLKAIFQESHGKNRVFFFVSQNGSSRMVATNFYIAWNDQIKKNIEDIVGSDSVVVKIASSEEN